MGTYQEALWFTGSTPLSGEIQLEILKRAGLKPRHRVLEIGCGALHGALEIISYLEDYGYVGIEPNTWLVDAAIRERTQPVGAVLERKHAVLTNVADFDVSHLGRAFDYAFAHSILSHASDLQLEQFFRNVGKVLHPESKIVASIRLAQGNEFGSTGTPDKEGTHEEKWQYPGVNWFKLDDVVITAACCGFKTCHVPEYGQYYASLRPSEHHDWLVFTKL